MFCVLSDEERREGQRVLQPSESQTEHDVPALSTVISYTGLEGFFLFELTVQPPEATKLKSVAIFHRFVCYILLPIICLTGTG